MNEVIWRSPCNNLIIGTDGNSEIARINNVEGTHMLSGVDKEGRKVTMASDHASLAMSTFESAY